MADEHEVAPPQVTTDEIQDEVRKLEAKTRDAWTDVRVEERVHELRRDRLQVDLAREVAAKVVADVKLQELRNADAEKERAHQAAEAEKQRAHQAAEAEKQRAHDIALEQARNAEAAAARAHEAQKDANDIKRYELATSTGGLEHLKAEQDHELRMSQQAAASKRNVLRLGLSYALLAIGAGLVALGEPILGGAVLGYGAYEVAPEAVRLWFEGQRS